MSATPRELADELGLLPGYAARLTALEAGGVWQPADADLAAIAALTTTAYGRGLLTLANATALQALVFREQTFMLYDASAAVRGVGFYFARTAQTVTLTILQAGLQNLAQYAKSTAAAPDTFGSSTAVNKGTPATGIALQAGATLRIEYPTPGNNTTWAHVQQTA